MKTGTDYRYLEEPVMQVVRLLIEGKYEQLAEWTNRRRLSASEMRDAIMSYGRRLVLPPANVVALMDIVPIRDASPKAWSVRIPLWTKEEGRSDLTLELTVISLGRKFSIEVDDLRVL